MTEPTRVVRLDFLDALRAVAAVMVMIEHFRGSARLERLQYQYVSLGIAGVLTSFCAVASSSRGHLNELGMCGCSGPTAWSDCGRPTS